MSRISLTLQLFTLFILTTVCFSSCVDTKKIAYLSDVQDSLRVASSAGPEAIIQPKDILSIQVSSISPESNAIFNAPNISGSGGSASGNQAQTSGYLVDQSGNIKFPILGEVKAEAMTPKQVGDEITKLLIEKKLLYDPVVSVRLINFRVTVLGEVNRPGVVIAPNEQLNIFEALGQAGDLTIYGLRDNVKLIRQEGDSKVVKRLDLNSSSLLSSPYYVLKSNDVIYVEPGKAKVGSLSSTRQILPIVLSSLSLIAIIVNTLIK